MRCATCFAVQYTAVAYDSCNLGFFKLSLLRGKFTESVKRFQEFAQTTKLMSPPLGNLI
jgi:hypothetical protein